ncbi:hypothetical protein MKW92_025701 [Papaver armeniacum]|nr:hypothetical protein MKW92_025701 [Papaver armeniacum]
MLRTLLSRQSEMVTLMQLWTMQMGGWNRRRLGFNSRIAFCLNLHNEAVCALRFPPNSHNKEKQSAEI